MENIVIQIKSDMCTINVLYKSCIFLRRCIGFLTEIKKRVIQVLILADRRITHNREFTLIYLLYQKFSIMSTTTMKGIFLIWLMI